MDPHKELVEHSYYRFWPWAVVVIVIIFTAAIRIRLLEAPLERDEGEYAYAGQLILQGIWPYQAPSLYKYKMPGIYFIYALVLAIFGQTQAGVHTGLLFTNIGAIIILFLIARKLFDNVAAVTTAAIYAVLSMNPFVQGVFAHAEHFVVLSAAWGILILLGALEPYKWWKVLLSGLLFGLAFVIRQHGAAFVVFGGLYLLVNRFRRPEARWSKIVSSFAVFCLGAAVPLVMTCAVFLIVGVFDKFWFWTFVYAQVSFDGTFLHWSKIFYGMDKLHYKLFSFNLDTCSRWVCRITMEQESMDAKFFCFSVFCFFIYFYLSRLIFPPPLLCSFAASDSIISRYSCQLGNVCAFGTWFYHPEKDNTGITNFTRNSSIDVQTACVLISG